MVEHVPAPAPTASVLRRLARHSSALFGLLAVVVMWLVVLQTHHLEHSHSEREARRINEVFATALAEQASRLLRSVDQTLMLLRDHYVQILMSGSKLDIHAWMRNARPVTDLTFQVGIIGPDGIMVASSADTDGQRRLDLSDREHFRVHLDPRSDDVFISKPVLGRVTDKWSIQVSRRIVMPDGSFGGVAVVSMDPSYLAAFYDKVDLGRDGSVALVGTDGVMRARRKSGEMNAGFALGRSPMLAQVVDRNEGTLVARSQVDGVDRLYSHRRIAGYPLIVAVGQSIESLFEAHNQRTLFAITVAGLLTVVFAGVTGLVVWYQRGLAAARDTAEAATRVRTTFLATMSHEIRTPMNAVIGLSDALLAEPLPPHQRESVAAIHAAGENLLRIINDILDFSKMDAGRLELETAPFSPKRVVEGAIALVASHAAAKGLSIDLHMDEELPAAVLGDAGRLRQVLLNLLSNAVKYTEEGGVAIRVSCQPRSATRCRIDWQITDTGIGIPPEKVPSLFHDFSRIDSAVARRSGGTGLGLAICKRIVDRMGGTIAVNSNPGHGSTFGFSIEFQLASAHALESPAPSSDCEARLGALVHAKGSALRVLVVEDHDVNRMLVEKILSGVGVSTSAAADGIAAVEEVTREDFDLILMDVRMPNMDGLEATRRIRARGGRFARLPIVALTANAYPEDGVAAFAAGMTAFLAKPVRKPELLAAIVDALEGQTTPGPSIAAVEMRAAGLRTEPPLVDDGRLASLSGQVGDRGIQEMLRVFIRTTEQRLRTLETLAPDRDRDRIRDEAHTLKGAAATIGFKRLSDEALEMEREALDMTTADFVAAVAKLKAMFEATRAAAGDVTKDRRA